MSEARELLERLAEELRMERNACDSTAVDAITALERVERAIACVLSATAKPWCEMCEGEHVPYDDYCGQPKPTAENKSGK